MQYNCETGAGSAAVPIYGVRDRVPSIVTRLDRLGLVSVGYQLGTSFSTLYSLSRTTPQAFLLFRSVN